MIRGLILFPCWTQIVSCMTSRHKEGVVDSMRVFLKRAFWTRKKCPLSGIASLLKCCLDTKLPLENTFCVESIFLLIAQRWIRGTSKTFWSLMSQTITILLHLWERIFGNFWNLEFYVRQFVFKKFPKISKKNLEFCQPFQNRKQLLFLYPN